MARTTTAGLSLSDLERIRDTLASGRRPKVVFTDAAGQMAGQTGQVVQLTDPEASAEWLVVRFGNDELPFSPADLRLPARNGADRSRPATATAPRKEVAVSAATTARSPRLSPPAAPERTAASAATTAADRADSTAARADSTGATGRV